MAFVFAWASSAAATARHGSGKSARRVCKTARTVVDMTAAETMGGSSSLAVTPVTTTVRNAPKFRRLVIFEETYGCAMNIADTQVVRALIAKELKTEVEYTTDENQANVFLLNTCAIRENAEQRVMQRLKYLRTIGSRRPKEDRPVVAVLGCMAEHLKHSLLDDKLCQIVMGPDAYRELPSALRAVTASDGSDMTAYNVQLSAEDTYAEISPVRDVQGEDGNVSAFLTVMRGCANACSFCVVPRTRGAERSRDLKSVVREIRELSEQGFKEVVLLGQNVNSYNDVSQLQLGSASARPVTVQIAGKVQYAAGFETRYPRRDRGLVFADLLSEVSAVDPEMRIRFTSPHPKDYPDEMIDIMSKRANICKQVHVPAQSGSTPVLARMNRGYSREAYLELVDTLRSRLPGVALSTDIIAGFCGETLDEHAETVSLMQEVGFENAFMYAYSVRSGTPAAVHLVDTVSEEEKGRRLAEIISVFHKRAEEKNQAEIGRSHLVLVEGQARAKKLPGFLTGRTDTNKRVFFKDVPIQAGEFGQTLKRAVAGDYVEVVVESATSLTMRSRAIRQSSIQAYARAHSL
ncbi:CDK5RAP1-like protein [Porphyridium purpureum]|uniref:CDK5RAP1-like protein n=1 Tax=Porphyridium purpureum TaxID=35688 RepID=A0A5J4Z1R3_PORPP|nr:CDK5RAP1-like protein [Porphyridium purpureum]|eukprot:POR1151..scf208_2